MHIPQKGYAYASKEAALSHRQAGSGNASEGSDNSDADDSDAPQPSGPPGKQLRMPPISASAHENDEDSDGYASVSSGSSSSSSSDGSDSEDDDDDDDAPIAPAPQYPILGARARKRVRPPTSYHKQMAVYVRVCLLNLRHATEDQPDVDLKDEDHVAFHQALREHRVERVLVADSPPPEKPSSNDKSPDDVGAVPRSSSISSDKDKKRSKKSSSKDSAASPMSKKAKTEPKAIPPAASPATTETKATPPPFAASSSHRAKPSAPDAASRESPPKAASTVTPPTTSALSAAKHSSSKGVSSSSSSTGGSSSLDLTDSMSPADKSPVKRPMSSGTTLGDSSSDGHPATKKARVTAAAAALPPASFQIPANADVKDMDRVRRDISKLQKEGIALKHEGDRVGRADVAAQGVCYLRASVKFLKQALLLSDLKAMYKALNDSATASKWSKDSISTLSQTAALVESTVGFFNKAHDKRKVALSYKFAAIVMLTSYRLQHNMLYGYYSQLHAPGRSPDGGDLVSKANEDPIRSLILKEMGAMMRGFEFWRRYEACSIPDVLPTVRDPTTVDLPSLWQELDAELLVPSAGH